jgi:hypothetical protein
MQARSQTINTVIPLASIVGAYTYIRLYTHITLCYTGWSKCLCTWRLHFPHKWWFEYGHHRIHSECGPLLCWTRSSRTQFGVSINVWRLVGDTLNITCNILYCNHQVQRDFWFILYMYYVYNLCTHKSRKRLSRTTKSTLISHNALYNTAQNIFRIHTFLENGLFLTPSVQQRQHVNVAGCHTFTTGVISMFDWHFANS